MSVSAYDAVGAAFRTAQAIWVYDATAAVWRRSAGFHVYDAGAAAWRLGLGGNSVKLTQDATHIRSGSEPITYSSYTRTAEFWVNWPSTGVTNESTPHFLAGHYSRSNGSDNGWAVLATRAVNTITGRVFISRDNGAGGTIMSEVTSFTIGNVDTWNHVAVTIDFTPYGTSNPVAINTYVNGVLQTSITPTLLLQGAPTDAYTFAFWDTFYGNPASWYSALNIKFHDIRLWSTVRTATEIANNRKQRFSSRPTGMMCNYQMTEGSGTFFDDFGTASTTFDGNANGTVTWGIGDAPI